MKNLMLSLLFLIGSQVIFANTDSLFSIRASRDIIIFQNKLEVIISIHKPAERGFARIYEKLPSGSKVLEVKCGNGYYKADKMMLKIAWDDIPNDTTIEVHYIISLSEELTDTINEFKGTFSAEFMANNQDQIDILHGKKSYHRETLLAMKTAPSKTDTETTSSELSSTNKKEITTNLDTYICIQVAAVGSNVSADYLSKKFGYPGEFESHFEENFYRITIGKYHSVNEAQAALKELKAQYFDKCFLSAYKDGHKIPVYKAENMLN